MDINRFTEKLQEAIRAAQSKATRYGNIGAPYVICLNKQSLSLSPIEIGSALYGPLSVSWSADPRCRDEKTGYNGHGFFGNSKNPKFTRVSAVFITNANPGNLSKAKYFVRHNPFATHPLAVKWDSTINEIFNVPKQWPFVS